LTGIGLNVQPQLGFLSVFHRSIDKISKFPQVWILIWVCCYFLTTVSFYQIFREQ